MPSRSLLAAKEKPEKFPLWKNQIEYLGPLTGAAGRNTERNPSVEIESWTQRKTGYVFLINDGAVATKAAALVRVQLIKIYMYNWRPGQKKKLWVPPAMQSNNSSST